MRMLRAMSLSLNRSQEERSDAGPTDRPCTFPLRERSSLRIATIFWTTYAVYC
jgi:hypothetical protein